MRQIRSLLVTGGSGFIGSAFIRKLLCKDNLPIKIINLDQLTYAALPQNVQLFERDFRYRFQKGNICDPNIVKEILSSGVDAIVHFAAETHVDRSISSSKPFVDTNIYGTWNLLEMLRFFPKVHFHHVSTDEVYGSLGKEGKFTENSPYLPNSPYSASKAASDHLVRAFAKTYQLSTTISHCSNNYGEGQYPEKLIPLMIANCLAKRPLPIYGDGMQVREWIHVDDHVDAIWTVLQKGKSGEVYDIGGAKELSNLALVHLCIDLLAKETKQDPEIYRSLLHFVEDRKGHDFRYAIDGSKIRKALGWSPKIPFEEGLAATIRMECQKQGVLCLS